MKKLFNKKTMKVYVVLLVISFITGCVCAGLNSKFKKDFNEATKADVSEAISGALTSIISSIAGTDLTGNTDKEKEYDEATKAIIAKEKTSLALMIVFYVLTAVFIGGAVTASEYDRYLESDKYKAKLKRQEKAAKKISANNKG